MSPILELGLIAVCLVAALIWVLNLVGASDLLAYLTRPEP
jgi:hypothetical protein